MSTRMMKGDSIKTPNEFGGAEQSQQYSRSELHEWSEVVWAPTANLLESNDGAPIRLRGAVAIHPAGKYLVCNGTRASLDPGVAREALATAWWVTGQVQCVRGGYVLLPLAIERQPTNAASSQQCTTELQRNTAELQCRIELHCNSEHDAARKLSRANLLPSHSLGEREVGFAIRAEDLESVRRSTQCATVWRSWSGSDALCFWRSMRSETILELILSQDGESLIAVRNPLQIRWTQSSSPTLRLLR